MAKFSAPEVMMRAPEVKLKEEAIVVATRNEKADQERMEKKEK